MKFTPAGAGLGARRRRRRSDERQRERVAHEHGRLTPMRAGGVEEALAGGADPATAAAASRRGSAPPSDSFGCAEYRRELSKVLVRRALEEALAVARSRRRRSV